MMRTWRVDPAERTSLFGAIGLRLLDALTGRAPVGRVRTRLELQEAGAWYATDVRAVEGPSRILTWPGLGRSREAGGPPRRYRVTLEAELYRPLYRVMVDGIEFDAHPYSNTTPPQQFATSATDTLLVPADPYPFPAELRVLRGVIVDAGGTPIADAIVTEGGDRAVSGRDGTFALPLRTAAEGAPVAIAAAHPRSGRGGSINVTLPGDLRRSASIPVQ
jgi:hypothetical protein